MQVKHAFLLCIVFASIHLTAYTQDGLPSSFQMDVTNNIRVFDANGKPFENTAGGDVAGSPFFMSQWKYGYITLNDNKTYSKRLVRLNFQTQQVHYLSEKNVEMSLNAGSVKEITIFDSTSFPVAQYHFMSELPPIDNQNEKNFYQVLSKGKVSLLKSTRKNLIVDRNDLTGDVTRELRTYEDYYFFTGVSLQRVKKDKAYITGILKDKKDPIEQYMKANNFTCKSIQEIQKIVEYYNSLP